MRELSTKARGIEQSVTLAITAKAKELRGNGINVISFAAGEPDFNTPENILDAAKRAMYNGNTKYTQTSGIIELRKAICKKLKDDNGIHYDASQIVISTGAKQSLANAFMAILNPGDEVIIAVPYWVSYPELIKLADGNPIFINTGQENNYKYTVAELEKVITSRSKAIILNNPNNPTGTIYTKEELESISDFAKRNNLIIISDEIYEKLIYDGKKHISIASLNEDTKNRTIIINGFSKSYSMTGWRVGYTASSTEIKEVHHERILEHHSTHLHSSRRLAWLVPRRL
jgi:aspartate aminotransferase